MQGGLPNYEILATNKNKGKLRHRPHEMCHPVYLFSSVPSKFQLPTLSFFFCEPAGDLRVFVLSIRGTAGGRVHCRSEGEKQKHHHTT
jgi:hypothetical protein